MLDLSNSALPSDERNQQIDNPEVAKIDNQYIPFLTLFKSESVAINPKLRESLFNLYARVREERYQDILKLDDKLKELTNSIGNDVPEDLKDIFEAFIQFKSNTTILEVPVATKRSLEEKRTKYLQEYGDKITSQNTAEILSALEAKKPSVTADNSVDETDVRVPNQENADRELGGTEELKSEKEYGGYIHSPSGIASRLDIGHEKLVSDLQEIDTVIKNLLEKNKEVLDIIRELNEKDQDKESEQSQKEIPDGYTQNTEETKGQETEQETEQKKGKKKKDNEDVLKILTTKVDRFPYFRDEISKIQGKFKNNGATNEALEIEALEEEINELISSLIFLLQKELTLNEGLIKELQNFKNSQKNLVTLLEESSKIILEQQKLQDQKKED
jgi:hypothetical protein